MFPSKLLFTVVILYIIVSKSQCFDIENVTRTEVVHLKNGDKVSGYVQTLKDGNKVNVFQGIRYASAKRFQLPTPVSLGTEVYDATKYRAACVQFGNLFNLFDFPIKMTKQFDEDCLFLSIWQPVSSKNNETKSRAVMAWIHGGAFEVGTIFTDLYDGAMIASKGDVIVVSIAYRLGPLGFLAGGDVKANLGLYDQLSALHWIQDNIAHFGGDPRRVTIFGESAGSASVGALILSPLSNGLFDRAIFQSGSPATDQLFDSPIRAKEKTRLYARKLNCTNQEENLTEEVRCISGKNITELKRATYADFSNGKLFAPSYGDLVLPLKPADALRIGSFHRNLDILYGVVRDEGTVFLPLFFPELMNDTIPLTRESAKKTIIELMKHNDQGLIAEEVADFYIEKQLQNSSTPSSDELKALIGSVSGDMSLVCPTVLFVEEYVRTETLRSVLRNNFYAYRLMQAATGISEKAFPKWMGVTHGQDIFYLFLGSRLEATPALHNISNAMIETWTTFAKTGKPGTFGSVPWESAFVEHETKNFNTKTLLIELPQSKMVNDVFKKTCDIFWKPRIFG